MFVMLRLYLMLRSAMHAHICAKNLEFIIHTHVSFAILTRLFRSLKDCILFDISADYVSLF